MPEKLYALSEDDVTTLREIVRAYRAGDLGRPLAKGRSVQGRPDIVLGSVDSSIAATTGATATPTSGTMSVYNFTSTGGTSDSGRNETAYNVSATAISTAQYVVGVRDYKSGKFLALQTEGSLPKRLCRFTLDAALTTTTASAAALINAQYGPGVAHSTTSTITAYNLAVSADYLFEGSSGNCGLAYWDSGTDWRIIQMECT